MRTSIFIQYTTVTIEELQYYKHLPYAYTSKVKKTLAFLNKFAHTLNNVVKIKYIMKDTFWIKNYL
jgi:hypothetical protein